MLEDITYIPDRVTKPVFRNLDLEREMDETSIKEFCDHPRLSIYDELVLGIWNQAGNIASDYQLHTIDEETFRKNIGFLYTYFVNPDVREDSVNKRGKRIPNVHKNVQPVSHIMNDDKQNYELLRDQIALLEEFSSDDFPVEQVAEVVIRNGNEAKELLRKYNMKLVVKIALKHRGRGVPLNDMIQQGTIGLMQDGLAKLEITRGLKISTYIAWWIRHAITRQIANEGRIIRIPEGMIDKINRYTRDKAALAQELGGNPSLNQLGEALKMKPAEVYKMEILSRSVLSLDEMVEKNLLGHYTSAQSGSNNDSAEIVDIVSQALKTLTHREREILSLRFGFEKGDELSLADIGRIMGLSGARIGQILDEVFIKLKKILGPEFDYL